MIVKRIGKKELFQIQILRNFYQTKHILLIGMGMREKEGKNNTVIDIGSTFNLRREYAWKLLAKLKKDGLIKKGEKIRKDNKSYCNYILTPVAKESLHILASWLHKFNNAGGVELGISSKHLCLFLADLDTVTTENAELDSQLHGK